jgi:hypothetical protein
VRTEEFTVGVDRPPVRFPTIFCPRSKVTSELSILVSSVNRSSWCPWPTPARSEPTRMASAGGQLPKPPARGSPRDLAIGIDASEINGEINGPVWSLSGRGTTGAFRSSRTDRGAQVLPLGGATVPPWLPAKSARVSNLPACCALGPPACAAPCSCHHEPCTGHSAWPPRGMADPFAWIEPRSGGRRSP